MASTTVTVRVEREGLNVRTFTGEKLISTINLQEYWGLSDDNAAYVLKKLDEKERAKA